MPATILIVEDEALIRLALVELIEELGYRVVDVGSAPEAISVLKANVSVALVFTDVHMPGGATGLDLAEWVKHYRPGVPVVVTSGATSIQEAGARTSGQAHFIEKPYDFDHVGQVISALVDPHSTPNQ